MNKTSLSLAIFSSCSLSTAMAEQQMPGIEVIQIQGSYFNDYKVDNASGATRVDTPLLETAQSVTVIPITIIDEQLATTLGEVVANDASLTAGSKQRNREVFSSRGFELSSSTGYLRDGHQHWSHYQQPIETLDSVEIIKGPASILYGQSAPGGLINMVTKKPTHKQFTNVSMDTDQNGSNRFTLDSGGALSNDESLRYRTVLVKQDVIFSREYENGEERERDRFLGSMVLDYDVSDELLLRIHYDRTEDKAGLDTGAWLDESGEIIGDDKTIYDMSWAFTDINVENTGIDLTYYLAESWQVKLGYNEQNFERQRFESAPKKPDDYQAGDSYQSKPYDRFDDWQFKTTFIDFSGEFELVGITHQLLLGANSLDYYYGQLKTSADSFEYVPGSPEPEKPNISYKTDDSLYTSAYDYYGVYVQDLITFNEFWQLSIGARYDKQNKQGADNESILPKFGIMYHPNNDATIYASYTEGFEPQSSETITDETDSNYGMNIDAITSEQIELGAKWQVSERLLVTTAYFDIEKSGSLITEALFNDPNYDSITTQSGLQRHQGFEFSAQGAVTDKLFMMASAMNLDAEFERDENYQGKTPVDAPQWSASLWGRYELSENVALNAGVFYQGDRFADSENTIEKESYTRVDLGATYTTRFASNDINFRVNVENLFDTNYLAGGGTNNVTVGEERTVRFEVKASF
ncbi:TonB-dependent siderophore receptor [Thalassotalea fonticola]|uniref:TonB-dependent siderophore receptor n=1 Tax=Thalassotalea fonticola TaxID=3065649 RepID=A0ABZ0GRS3_9GAMM|nr:TonB-dependent siderophore receptor [Colwelliaceae bacterium S1-1]